MLLITNPCALQARFGLALLSTAIQLSSIVLLYLNADKLRPPPPRKLNEEVNIDCYIRITPTSSLVQTALCSKMLQMSSGVHLLSDKKKFKKPWNLLVIFLLFRPKLRWNGMHLCLKMVPCQSTNFKYCCSYLIFISDLSVL